MSLARCLSSLSNTAASAYFVLVGAAAALASALLPVTAITAETSEETNAPSETAAKTTAAPTDDAQEAAIETESEYETEVETVTETESGNESESESENEKATEGEPETEDKSEGESEAPASLHIMDDLNDLHMIGDDSERASTSTSAATSLNSSAETEMNTTATKTKTETKAEVELEPEADLLRALLIDAEERADVLAHLLARAEARIEALEAHNDDAATDYCAAMDLVHARGKKIARLESKLAQAIKHATLLEIELDAATAIAARSANQVGTLERRVCEMERQLAVRHEEVACARSSESEAAGSRSRSRSLPHSHSLPEHECEREPAAPPSRPNTCGSTQAPAHTKRDSTKAAASHARKTTKTMKARRQTGAADTASAASRMPVRPRWR